MTGTVVEKDGKMYCKFEENRIVLPEAKAKVLKEQSYVGKEVVMGIRPEDIKDDEEL